MFDGNKNDNYHLWGLQVPIIRTIDNLDKTLVLKTSNLLEATVV